MCVQGGSAGRTKDSRVHGRDPKLVRRLDGSGAHRRSKKRRATNLPFRASLFSFSSSCHHSSICCHLLLLFRSALCCRRRRRMVCLHSSSLFPLLRLLSYQCPHYFCCRRRSCRMVCLPLSSSLPSFRRRRTVACWLPAAAWPWLFPCSTVGVSLPKGCLAKLRKPRPFLPSNHNLISL